MILRRLEQTEHGKTRKLWEEVFTEDTREFLDYYYFVKARDNHIFVIEEDDGIRAMLQLNPYELHMGKGQFRLTISLLLQRSVRIADGDIWERFFGNVCRKCMEKRFRLHF